ncbi:MAG: 4-hydroxy-3-methylbut-2-enyl diphosphate reductase [Deltaproteobacteria bacterium]|nr:4-hydroxy-3-methylbut-2-enyl diphosphate reductase [Deltaproteobacteria bacterium]
MKVKQARTAGFCMGVRRAMEMVLAEANKNRGPIYTYGPLIHNRQVMGLLESKGITAVDDFRHLKQGTLVIRAHGIPPDERKLLRASGLHIIDATCPRVAKVQAIIRYHTKKGYCAVIVGDRDHPEVIGLVGYGNDRAYVINEPREVAHLPDCEQLIVVAQTTQDEQKFQKIVAAVKDRFPDALLSDTICDATRSRQEEVRSFARQVDGLIVVGGYHSGNTQRLVQVAEGVGLPTFHVETEDALDRDQLSQMEVVAVTAGASTPNWMIKDVVRAIERIRTRKETAPARWLRNAIKFLLLSNLGVALGAACLAHAAAMVAGRKPDLLYPCLAFLYIYSMHVANRFLDKGASTYNDPEMASFYSNNRIFLILTSLASMIGVLALSYFIGPATFFAMAALSILGVLYSMPIVPPRLQSLSRFSKIKDIPGSKTLSVALAWGAVTALIPLLESSGVSFPGAVVSFIFVISVTYVRSALFDIFQAQGDLIVGVETLPIVMGEKRTIHLLKWVLCLGALILFFSPLFGVVGPFSYLMLLCLLTLALCLLAYHRHWLYPGTRLEAMVEGNLYLAGLLGLAWQLLT